MTPEQYEARREKLRALMHDRGLDALFISYDANRFYLSGFELHDHQFNESSGYLIIMADGKDWICTDSRYLDAARRMWDHDRIFIYAGDIPSQINAHLQGLVRGTIGFEARCMSLDFFEKFSPNLTLDRADGIVEELRIIKSPEEVERMQRACDLNHKLMAWLPSVLVPGRTEKAISWDIEQFFRNHGASELAFESIVAVGPNAALPHHSPSDDIVTDNCSVLIDVGCRLDTYCSDQTRTFWVGDRPTDHFLRALERTQEAQAAAIKALRAGMLCSEAYAIARNVFERYGVADHFTHALGHGIGIETHEPPSHNPRNHTVLRAGMVVTVEPGLYYPEWGGIRWEHMVLIEDEGVRVF